MSLPSSSRLEFESRCSAAIRIAVDHDATWLDESPVSNSHIKSRRRLQSAARQLEHHRCIRTRFARARCRRWPRRNECYSVDTSHHSCWVTVQPDGDETIPPSILRQASLTLQHFQLPYMPQLRHGQPGPRTPFSPRLTTKGAQPTPTSRDPTTASKYIHARRARPVACFCLRDT